VSEPDSLDHLCEALGILPRYRDHTGAVRQVPEATLRALVQRLGAAMRSVSLLGPDSIVRAEMDRAYGDVVSPELLATWKEAPRAAPGREVSNPWPARIQIDSVHAENDACRIDGDVVYVTSADTLSAVARTPVTIRVVDQRIAAYHVAHGDSLNANTTANTTATEVAPADVIRRYYAAINQRGFDQAYRLWSQGGRASGQTLREFRNGYAQTDTVAVEITGRIAMEGAAGSQYATVPVLVSARLQNGRQQRFAGTYTLRRSMVDGATAQQRAWRIYQAALSPVK